MTRTPPPSASLTVLLVDDSQSQSVKIQKHLHPYRIWVDWRPSYRTAVELLRDPDAGQLVDLILIDQAFEEEAMPASDLLTSSEVDALTGAEGWDVHLHQGLFIMARLSQDMREGLIPFTPMMILTHYAAADIAAQVGLGGYQSKRRLLAEPYASLEEYLGQMRPTEEDVNRRLGDLARDLDLDHELAGQVRRDVLGGLDLDEVCAVIGHLPDPNDWRAVGRALEHLADERCTFPVERLATAIRAAWLPSPDGWLRICHVEMLGPLGHGFEAFRVEIRRSGSTFPALMAARALLSDAAPAAAELRRGFGLMREIDPRSRPVRLRDRSWTILGCWFAEPVRPDGDVRAADRLLSVTRHLRGLHRRRLGHGSLTVLGSGFDPPLFGGIRCLTGEHDLGALRADDLGQLPALAAATFGEEPDEGARDVLERWLGAIAAGDLAAAEAVLESAHLRLEPPAYVDLGRAHGGQATGLRDLLLASLGPDDALLREVGCEGISPVPFDFVVCAGGAIAVLEYRARLCCAAAANEEIAMVEVECDRCRRSIARCRRAADAFATRVEAGLCLPRQSVRRLAAIVVSDASEVHPHSTGGWRQVMTQADTIAELARISRARSTPRGSDMLRFLPWVDPRRWEAESASRALHWTKVPLGAGLVTMRTWRKLWPPDSWRSQLERLAAGREALRPLPVDERPLPLVALRAYDEDGQPRDVGNAASIELVEYDVMVPHAAAPLGSYVADPRSEAWCRRLAAAVARGLLSWERSPLAYVTMEPEGLLHAGDHVYCDLLQSVVPADAASRWRQRCGGAASLVFLLSPWPFAWPAALAGAMPALPDRPNERSAWGIAATAVAALLDRDLEPGRLEAVLAEKADLLEAAARLDRRFPSWPAGLTREALP
jgi:hypothetical protein